MPSVSEQIRTDVHTPRNYMLDVWARLTPDELQTQIDAVRALVTARAVPIPPELAAITAPAHAMLLHIQFNGKHGRIETGNGVMLEYIRGWEIGHMAGEARPHVRPLWVLAPQLEGQPSAYVVLQWVAMVLKDFAKLGLVPGSEAS